MKKFVTCALFNLLLFGNLLSQNGFQYWNEEEFVLTLSPKIDLTLSLEQQWLDKMTYFGMHNFTPGFTYHLNEKIDLSFKY